jgi:hypothetical protein
MKRVYLFVAVLSFLVITTGVLKAQTMQPQLNQVELMKQFLGSWQADYGKDTLEVWDCQQYGKAFLINVNQVIKGQKSPQYINNISFNSKEGKFYGFSLFTSGSRNTWIGSYVTEKKFNGDLITNFNPALLWGKIEIIFESSSAFTFKTLNKDGVMTSELKFKKMK